MATITASATGLTTATEVLSVDPAAPSKLTFTGAHYLKPTTCSSPLTISAADAYGNSSPVSKSELISLSGIGSGTLYNDISCSNAVNTVTLAPGASSSSVYLRDGVSQSLTLQASSADFGGANTSVNVTASGLPIPTVGAGLVSYACPGSATLVPPPVGEQDTLATVVANSKSGQTLCIEGEHRLSAPITPKNNQTWIGIGNDARISGAVQLTSWQPYSSGVWTYTGPHAKQENTLVDFATGIASCYTVSIYQDDLFYRTPGQNDDQRVMRVLSLPELTGALTTPGQWETAGENQRFFFDYSGAVSGSPAIYINFEPSNLIVDLPVLGTVVMGQGVQAVTLENLFIEKALNTAIQSGPSWTIQDTTIRFAHNNGLLGATGTQSARFILNRVLITNNGQYGVNGGAWNTFQNSEVSWNNIANYRKLASVPNASCGGYFASGGLKVDTAQGVSASVPGSIMTNNKLHHNIGPGGWDDIGSQYLTVTGNQIYSNEGAGYFHEIGCEIAFSGNQLYSNGVSIKNPDTGFGALHINSSNNGTFSNNIFHDNVNQAILLFLQENHKKMLSNPCLGASSDTDTSNSLKNNLLQSNTVYDCKTPGSIGQLDQNLSTAISRNNRFLTNSYHMGNATSLYWIDPFELNWPGWQSHQQDPDGTLTVGCTYP